MKYSCSKITLVEGTCDKTDNPVWLHCLCPSQLASEATLSVFMLISGKHGTEEACVCTNWCANVTNIYCYRKTLTYRKHYLQQLTKLAYQVTKLNNNVTSHCFKSDATLFLMASIQIQWNNRTWHLHSLAGLSCFSHILFFCYLHACPKENRWIILGISDYIICVTA